MSAWSSKPGALWRDHRSASADLAGFGAEASHRAGSPPHGEPVRHPLETTVVGLASLLIGAVILMRARWLRRLIATGEAEARLGLAITFGLLVSGLATNTILCAPAAFAAAIIVAATLSLSPYAKKPA